jgi:DNA-directed RNA polymerase specialized sigma24 family protein
MAKVSVLRLVDGRDKAESMALLASLGFKHTEIAEMLGMKPNTVSVALRRAKQKSEATE